MLNRNVLLLGWALLGATACGHVEVTRGAEPWEGLPVACAQGLEGACEAGGIEEGTRTKGGTVSTRIWALIGQGQFAEAQALIAESTAAGLIEQQQAAQMLERIAKLNTRLGDVSARLQRVANFPSQLKDYTLFQIRQMLDQGDYSLATQTQLRLAAKVLEEPERLMEKASNLQR